MRYFCLSTGLLITLLITAFNANAAIYKWIDENGTVVYSQTRPPAGSRSLDAPSLRPGPSSYNSSGPGTARRVSDPLAPESDSDGNSEIDEQQQAIDEACVKLRNNLKILKLSKKIYEKNDAGERIFLTESERLERVTDVTSRISDNCE